MDCRDVTTQLADYLAGTLSDDQLRAVREHLAGCGACRDEVAALDDTWQALGTVAPELPDSGAMRARFDAVLEGYHHALEQPAAPWRLRNTLASWWQPRYALQAAAAAVLLIAGIAVGRQTAPEAAPPPAGSTQGDQIAALRQELGDMRQMVTLSLLQQQSASERLRGVTFTSQIPQPGSEVVAALLDTLLHDDNVNVRLASIDALTRFAGSEVVRAATLDALGRQTSPLVQMALIDFVVTSAGQDSAAELRRLAQDSMVDAAVRGRAERGLAQLGARS